MGTITPLSQPAPGQPSAAQVLAIAQAALVIDPLNGTLNGTGSVSAPWRFASQFAQAVGAFTSNELNIAMTVTLKGSLPITDPFVRPRIGASGTLLVTGSPGATTLHTSSGGFTAVSAPNATSGTNEAQTLTDTALAGDWTVAGPGGTSLLGKRIRITSGARAGTICWPLKNIATKKARCTRPMDGSVSLPLASSPTLTTPAASDPYVVEDLPQMLAVDHSGYVDSSLGASTDTFYRTIFEGVRLVGVATTPLGLANAGPPSGLNGIVFVGCDLGALGGSYQARGCLVDNGTQLPGDYLYLMASGCLSSFDTQFLVRGQLWVDYGTVFQGLTMIVLGDGDVAWIDGALFDAPGNGIALDVGSSMSVDGPCYGKGNATRGIHLATPGSNVGLKGVTPTLTGAGGDVLVGSTGKTWAEVVATPTTVAGSTIGTVT